MAETPETEIAIPGLRLVPDYLTADKQQSLLSAVEASPWQEALRRRVQQYGWKYRYDRCKRSERITPLGGLPSWAQLLSEDLFRNKLVTLLPDQLIVNEYLPGQGISPHVDDPGFGPDIVSISLGSPILSDMYAPEDDTNKHPLSIDLQPGSALILSGPARTEWKHGIRARKSDIVDGVRRERMRRISLTFRTVVQDIVGQNN